MCVCVCAVGMVTVAYYCASLMNILSRCS